MIVKHMTGIALFSQHPDVRALEEMGHKWLIYNFGNRSEIIHLCEAMNKPINKWTSGGINAFRCSACLKEPPEQLLTLLDLVGR